MTTYANVGHILLKRGNTVQSNAYTGKLGELTINTDTNEVAVHNGATVGGVATLASTASATAINVAISNLTNSVSTITGIDATFVANINALLANAASQDTAINNITNGSVTFGNIIPSANVTYSLGTVDAQWKDLWVSNNTIYIGNTPLTVNNDGTLLINGNVVGGGAGVQGNLILPTNVDLQASPAVQTTGIVFGDGTFQNTAYTGSEGTKTWTNPNNNVWRIEEYNSGAAIQYIRTATTTYSTTSTITQADPDFITIDFNSDSYVETILNNSTVTAVEINGTTYQITGGYSYGSGTVSFPAAGVTYDPGMTATLTFIDWQAPLQPVLWYDPANSRSGNNNFRGAIVEYHAYCSNGGTVVGKVMISRDWQAVASHEESTAGSGELSFYEFWNLGDNNGSQPGKLYLFINDPSNSNRTDTQVWIQWTSKIFYGSEAWC